MQASSVPEEAVPNTFCEQFPRLVGVIVFRLSTAALSAALFLLAFRKIGSVDGVDTAAGAVLAFLFFGIPSLVIAGGLAFRQRWAGWIAVGYDSAFLSYLFGRGLTTSLLKMDVLMLLIVITVLLVFLYEGMYVLTWLRDTRRARVFYYTTPAVVVFAWAAVVLTQHALIIHRARPLLAYADKHWVRMPGDLFCFDSSIKYDPQTGCTLITFTRGHAISGQINAGIDEVRLVAKDLGRGRWQFPGNAKRSGAIMAVMYVCGTSPDDVDLLDTPEPDRARAILQALGTREHGLSYDGKAGEVLVPQVSPWPDSVGRVIGCSYGAQGYMRELWSPRSQTSCYVDLNSECELFVRPQRSIEVPEAH